MLGTSDGDQPRLERYDDLGVAEKESKVNAPKRFAGKRGDEVYRWFLQLRLLFESKPRSYRSDDDKTRCALSYMTGAAQSWAMPILLALVEGRRHDLLLTL